MDETALNSLPEDSIPGDLPFVEDNEAIEIDKLIVDVGPKLAENEKTNQFEEIDDYQTLVETDESIVPLQVDNIKNAISFPTASKKAINEFEIDSLASLLFPKLFPTGEGDPTTKSNFKTIIFLLLINRTKRSDL